MWTEIVLMCSAGVATAARGRRLAERTLEYEGTFPGDDGLSARRSIFADPRFQQGIEPSILRRYKHMEKLINFYDQSITNITKYWTYGCWCFQMGDYPLRIGNGAPVDDVDKICKRQKECYQCAKKDAQENGESCIAEETSYKFKAHYDSVTNEPVVQCTNNWGSCKRNLCECDRAFASRLPEASASDNGWTGSHHAHYGGFDSRTNCLSRIHTPGKDFQLECCGDFPDRFPYRFAKDGTGKQCCNKSIFNTESHDCCDGEVRSNGSC
jgi:hypothetical protein